MIPQVIIALSTDTRPAEEVARLVVEARHRWPDGDVVVMSVEQYERDRAVRTEP